MKSVSSAAVAVLMAAFASAPAAALQQPAYTMENLLRCGAVHGFEAGYTMLTDGEYAAKRATDAFTFTMLAITSSPDASSRFEAISEAAKARVDTDTQDLEDAQVRAYFEAEKVMCNALRDSNLKQFNSMEADVKTLYASQIESVRNGKNFQ